MAFRTETRIGATLALAFALAHVTLAGAETVSVRHRHLHNGKPGELQFSDERISFTEEGKGSIHSREWKYAEIQQLELSPGSLRILTYEDQKWKLGRDREYVFDQLPEGFAESVYLRWRDRLDQRFVADLPDKNVVSLWERPVKLLGRLRGSHGVLRAGTERVVYQTESPEQSRTWRFADIENIASAGPFDLSIVTREHHGTANAGIREFRFQLKERLPEAQFNDLWRRLNLARQSDFIQSSLQNKEHNHD